MAMTLAEMKVGMSDKVAQQIVDTFIRESEILEMMQFDDAVSPTGGSTLTYGYVQKKLPSQASFRALNSEYTANQATVEKKTVEDVYKRQIHNSRHRMLMLDVDRRSL